MHGGDELRSRIEDFAARARAGANGAAFVQQVEDVLAQGYFAALQLDAERRRIDLEMADLAGSTNDLDALRQLRRLAVETRTLERRATELRERLGVLRERFVALGGTQING